MSKMLSGTKLVEAKVDAMCEMILDGTPVTRAAARIKAQFPSGMTWDLWYALADGSYARGQGHAAQLYREKWAQRIADMPEADRPVKYKRQRPPMLPGYEAPNPYYVDQEAAKGGHHMDIIRLVGQKLGVDWAKIREVRASRDGLVVFAPELWA